MGVVVGMSARPSIRVVAVTQSDPFFTGRFFETFLEAAGTAGVELVEIVLLRNFNESRIALARRLAGFYPPGDLIRLAGRYVRAEVDERRGRPRSVEGIADRHGVAVRRLDTINDAGYLRTLRERRVDVLLSVAAPEIFRGDTLRAAPEVLNIHSGRLPDYRGMMPTFWALLDGQPEVVVTVHEMVERLDAGRVIAEFPVPIDDRDSAFAVSRKAKEVAGRRVAGLLGELRSGERPTGRDVEPAAGGYHGFPARSDAKRLRARGRSMM
jgi:methionyl-tRNA formyltransferase